MIFERLHLKQTADYMATDAGQLVVAKATGVAGAGTFLFGYTVNEFVAFAGLAVAVAGFAFQVWLGHQRLKIDRINARLRSVQHDVTEILGKDAD